MKILLAFGTRPEAIKMAPLVHALKAHPSLHPIVCVTAQHREMLDQVLDLFDISPDIDLNLMQPGQDLFDVTQRVLLGMREVIKTHTPELILVHGDTTTALATAMAGFYTNTPIGHVEAGLRTHNVLAPFPEEFNRQVVGKIARIHFAPTRLSRDNLLAEGVPSHNIHVTGNTVIDALHWVTGGTEQNPARLRAVNELLNRVLNFNFKLKRFVLITGHRRENFGDGFIQICQAVRNLSNTYPDVHFVYPVHLNPNVQRPVHALIGAIENIHLIDPLDYEPFSYLLKHAFIVLTDSGGIQEEAPSFGKPVLVMRETTERPEALAAGTVRLVGANAERIQKHVEELIDDPASYASMARASNPYGDGTASKKIVEILTTKQEVTASAGR